MFVIIVGGGKVGTYLARGLVSQDHEVVVIEKQARKAQDMASALDADITMIGDGCDPVVLTQAGIERADVVVADTGDDEDNLVVCLIALKTSNARCIARVNNPKNRAIFASLDHGRPITIISSTEIILDVINDSVNVRDYSIVTKLRSGDLELLKMTIGAGSPAASRRIAETTLPRNTIVVAVDRPGEELVVPSGDTVLLAGDDVIVLSRREQREHLRAVYARPAGAP